MANLTHPTYTTTHPLVITTGVTDHPIEGYLHHIIITFDRNTIQTNYTAGLFKVAADELLQYNEIHTTTHYHILTSEASIILTFPSDANIFSTTTFDQIVEHINNSVRYF